MTYSLSTYADGYGIWYCKVDFNFGVGNGPEGEKLKQNAVAAAKQLIRREIVARQKAKPGRLRYEIAANKLDSLNRLWSITVKERTEDK